MKTERPIWRIEPSTWLSAVGSDAPLGGHILAGLAGWIVCAATADADRAWRALLINFIYFTPLAAGMVVWPAAVMGSRGRWARTIEQPGARRRRIRPDLAADVRGPLVRQGALGRLDAVQDTCRTRHGSTRRSCSPATGRRWRSCGPWRRGSWRGGSAGGRSRWPVGLAFAYCVVFTLLGFDMVMALDPRWFSTLFGGYFFVSGLYAALAAWTLITALRLAASDKERLHDLGKLMVAFSLLTVYMMFSQLAPAVVREPAERGPLRSAAPAFRALGLGERGPAGGDLSRPAGHSADALVEADAEIPRRGTRWRC